MNPNHLPSGSKAAGKFSEAVSVGLKLGEFLLEEVPKLSASCEELRLLIVRLVKRNRQLNSQIKFHFKFSPDLLINHSTAKEEANGPKEVKKMSYYRVDRQGNPFQYVKKNFNHQEEENNTTIPCRKRRKTHRGKRKKKNNEISTLRRCITTFSQLIPKAQQLPKGILDVKSLLYDSFNNINSILSVLQSIPLNQWDDRLHQIHDDNDISSSSGVG